jgi:hypothetical protein
MNQTSGPNSNFEVSGWSRLLPNEEKGFIGIRTHTGPIGWLLSCFGKAIKVEVKGIYHDLPAQAVWVNAASYMKFLKSLPHVHVIAPPEQQASADTKASSCFSRTIFDGQRVVTITADSSTNDFEVLKKLAESEDASARKGALDTLQGLASPTSGSSSALDILRNLAESKSPQTRADVLKTLIHLKRLIDLMGLTDKKSPVISTTYSTVAGGGAASQSPQSSTEAPFKNAVDDLSYSIY